VGVVRDDETGKPLANVTIRKPWQRDDDPWGSATTDAKGRYELVGLPMADLHELQVSPPANVPYLPANVRVRSADKSLTPLTFDIRLKRQRAVQGRVTERGTRKPVRGWVEYRPLADNPHLKNAPKLAEDRFGFQSIVTARLDADGRFLLPVLPGKGVLLVRSNDPYVPAQIDPRNADRSILDKNDSELLNTVPRPAWLVKWHGYRLVDVAAEAKTVPGDVVLDAGKSLPLKLVDPAGKPCAAWVFGLGAPATDRGEELTAGAGTIKTLTSGERRRIYARSLDKRFAGYLVLGGEEKDAVTLKLRPAARIKGRLVDVGGQPMPGVSFQVAYEDGPGRPGLLFLENLAARLQTEAEKQREGRAEGFAVFSKWDSTVGNEATDEQGRFRIEGLIPGLPFELKVQLTKPSDDPMMQKARYIVGMKVIARPTGEAGKTIDLGELRVIEPPK
jgi:hypothetical protein